MIAAHSFSWIGIQTTFVFLVIYLQDILAYLDGIAIGRIGSTSFLVLNAVGALLPVLGLPWRYAPDVGLTATVRHELLGGENGVELYLKNEGCNPSGSFKDRGLAAGVALGVACGARRFCLPTQGNAGVAASLFSARLGLPGCLVYMPEGYEDGLYHREASYFGAGDERQQGRLWLEAGLADRFLGRPTLRRPPRRPPPAAPAEAPVTPFAVMIELVEDEELVRKLKRARRRQQR